jgi:N5-(cytidine 5'-diphosphoramidyl)-L-glutamine hydrolase
MRTIGITMRVDYHDDIAESRDAIDQKWYSFLRSLGVGVLLIPNITEFITSDILDNLSGLILTGGNDIGECKARDSVERVLLDYAKSKHLPVLGICRGMQMLGCYAGEQLKSVEGHVRLKHHLTGKLKHEVLCFHEHVLQRCPENYSVLAYSKDGEIEAIKHNSLPWEGWMWHPERINPFNTIDIERVRSLFCE